MAAPPGTTGTAGRSGAALARPGSRTADDTVAPGAVADRQRGHVRRRCGRHPRHRPADRRTARTSDHRDRDRLCVRAGHRSGLGTVPVDGGRRSDGAARTGTGGLRAGRRPRPGRIAGLRTGDRHHVRLVGADDRDRRVGTGHGHAQPLGEYRSRHRAGRLGRDGAVQPGDQWTGQRRLHRLDPDPSLPRGRSGSHRAPALVTRMPKRSL